MGHSSRAYDFSCSPAIEGPYFPAWLYTSRPTRIMSWNLSTERPKRVFHTFGKLSFDLANLQMNDNFCCAVAGNWWRHVGSIRQRETFFADDFICGGLAVCSLENSNTQGKSATGFFIPLDRQLNCWTRFGIDFPLLISSSSACCKAF